MLIRPNVEMKTNPDPRLQPRSHNDDIVQLREWGTHRVYPLTTDPAQRDQVNALIGSGTDCDIRLADFMGCISAHHARLFWDKPFWTILDVGGKNRIWVDGFTQTSANLSPGTEVSLGGVTLIAETEKTIGIRSFLARLIGSHVAQIEKIDEALRSIRFARRLRSPLVLRGNGDWVTIARDLHRRVLGLDQPFVFCTALSNPIEVDQWGIKVVDSFRGAVAAARGGTLCVRSGRPAGAMTYLEDAAKEDGAKFQIVVCEDSRIDNPAPAALSISIPDLIGRTADLPSIIEGYCRDAAADLETKIDSRGEVREWILRNAATTILEIQQAAYRWFAIRRSRTIEEAADLLKEEVTSLRGWLSKHQLSGHTSPTEEDADE
jgi:pSer/pThr/pTyr-binding forkhead associated (FHA) protein